MRPAVQGAALVLENRTGRILAMAGGFSYPLSQLNRVTQTVRQPGSTLKPLTYLAALNAGLQPNTLVMDSAITLPHHRRRGDSWSPQNYDGGGAGATTLRRGLEFSKNLVNRAPSARGIAEKAPASLQKVCDLALEAQIYAECERYYPFVLGAQPVRMVDLAAFYAAVANEGARPRTLRARSGRARRQDPLQPRGAGAGPGSDRPTGWRFYQLKTMLQGVTNHGTGRRAQPLLVIHRRQDSTSENENDAWFAGFTNEITIVVWVGYDNADGTRRTLGRANRRPPRGADRRDHPPAAWANGVPRTPLAPPSPRRASTLADASIDPRSQRRVEVAAFASIFRIKDGRMADTQYRLLPRETRTAMHPDAVEMATSGSTSDAPDTAGGLFGDLRRRPARPARLRILDPYGERHSRRAQGETYQPWPGYAALSLR